MSTKPVETVTHPGDALIEPLQEFGNLWKYVASSNYACWATNTWEKAADVAIRVFLVLSGTLAAVTLLSLAPAAVGVMMNQTKAPQQAAENPIDSDDGIDLDDYIEIHPIFNFWVVNLEKVDSFFHYTRVNGEELIANISLTASLNTVGAVLAEREEFLEACETECNRRNTERSKKPPPRGV